MDQADNQGFLQYENLTKDATREFNPEALIASSSLFLMAVISLFFGCRRSIDALARSLKEQPHDLAILKPKEAAMFPVYASITLFGIFLVFKIFAVEYLKVLVSIYSFIFGINVVFMFLRPLGKLLPQKFKKTQFTLTLNQKVEGEENDIEDWKFEFDYGDAIPFALALANGIIYLMTRHWICNDVIAICIAISALEYIHIDRALNGCILLGGLFLYDIFWVFGTGVMVFVATNFEAPIKVSFPKDVLTNGILSNNTGLLGLGDIVVPGLYISLLLRFDVQMNPNGNRLYFWTGYVAYIIGLLVTHIFMYTFRHAQPALLYLVPSILGLTLTTALAKGDFKKLMEYKDIPTEIEEKINAAREEKEKAKEKKKD